MRERISLPDSQRLVFCDRHGNGHLVDHTAHAIDIGDQFCHQALLSVVLGDTAQGHYAILGVTTRSVTTDSRRAARAICLII